MTKPVKREAVIFMGLQAAGKSTFYRQHFFRTHVRINRDLLRTKHRMQVMLETCLSLQQSFVSDNTNVTAEIRAQTIQPALAAGFVVVGYYFQPDLVGSLFRNAFREEDEYVPEKAVHDMNRRFEPPSLDEGFSKIYRVQIGEGGGFNMEEFSSNGGFSTEQIIADDD